MRINFRQGIISHQSGGFLLANGGNIDLLAANKPVTVSLAHHDTNYTHSEDNIVSGAWSGPFAADTNYYLYWEFSQLTFERTFNKTLLEPVAQSAEPGSGNALIVGVVPGITSPAFASFEVAGHYILPVNKPFSVVNSTANDGSYTVQSATYNLGTGTTTIVVNEVISDVTIDGELTLDLDFNGVVLLTEGRTWFDTANNIHYERVGNTWVEILRVYAAQIFNSTFISLSQTGNFTGTQIGNNNTIASGRVLFAEAGNPLRRDDGTFFTTEDQFFTNQSRVDAIRLESNVARAQSDTGVQLAAFSIVAWSGNGKILPAQYNDTGDKVVGVLTETINVNEVGAVIIQGVVTNHTAAPPWTWTTTGANLWILNGQLTEIDPHVSDPITYLIPQVPVARVLSTDTVIFEQGLGGVGPQGPTGNIPTLPIAQEDSPSADPGVTHLTADPNYSGVPIAISTNHPMVIGDIALNDLTNVSLGTFPLTIGQSLTYDGLNWTNFVIDGTIRVYYQTTEPIVNGVGEPLSAIDNGDIWFDITNDLNRSYYYDHSQLVGSRWVDLQDSEIADAIDAAASAQSTADGKITTFIGSTFPTVVEGIGDLFSNTTDKILYRVIRFPVQPVYDPLDWEIVGNSFDTTSLLTDDANLGGTADWSGVNDDGAKPADNADVTNTTLQTGTTITDGGITLDGGGKFHSAGKDSFSDITPGFYMGWDTAEVDYTFFVGDPTNHVSWDGTNLEVTGSLSVVDWTNLTDTTFTKPTDNANVTTPMQVAAKINYIDFTTANDGEIFIHGYDDTGALANVDGVIVYNNSTVSLPRDYTNPSVACEGYIVYRPTGWLNGRKYAIGIPNIANSYDWTMYYVGALYQVTLAVTDIVIGVARNSAGELTESAAVWGYGVGANTVAVYAADGTNQVLQVGTTITGGGITLDAGGNIKGGQTAYATGDGFFLGYESGYKFSVGNATDYMKWDGSALNIAGSLSIQSGSTGIANLIDAGDLVVQDRTDLLYTDGADPTLDQLAGSGINMAPAEYSRFEANDVLPTMFVPLQTVLSLQTITYNSPQALRIEATASDAFVYLNTVSTKYNIPVEGGKKYIFSAYLRLDPAGTPKTTNNVTMYAKRDNDAVHMPVILSVPADSSYERYDGVIDLTLQPDTKNVVLRFDNDSFNSAGSTFLYIDGVMFEEQIGNNTEPSPYVLPYSSTSRDLQVGTTITGGGITLDAGGNIKGGSAAYATGDGFFLGYESGDYKFSVGTATNYLTWDGTNLDIAGSLTIQSGSSGIVNLTDAGDLAVQDRTDLLYTDGADVTQTAIEGTTTITGGGITLSSGGSLKTLNKDSYNDTTAGVFIGWSGSAYTMGIGNATDYLQWDGSNLTVNGTLVIGGTDLTSTNTLNTNTTATNVGLGNVDNLDSQGTTESGLQTGTTITGGGITLSSGGNIKGGQTTYATGDGFFLGYEAAAYKFSVGNATDYMKWDGSALNIAGSLSIQSGSTGIANLIDAGDLVVQDRTDLLYTDGADPTLDQLAGSGINMAPAEYSRFEANDVLPLMLVLGGGVVSLQTVTYNSPQALRLEATSTDDYVFLNHSATKYNVPVEGGKKYIFSAYLRLDPAGTPKTTNNVMMYAKRDNDAGHSNTGIINVPADGNYARYSGIIDLSAHPDTKNVVLRFDNDSFNSAGSTFLYIDGVMFEDQIGNNTEPSAYVLPYSSTSRDLQVGTTITGGGITLDAGGNIKGGQTAYATGDGFFLGYEAADYKFSVGGADSHMKWSPADGLQVKTGDITVKGIEINPSGDNELHFYAPIWPAGPTEEVARIGLTPEGDEFIAGMFGSKTSSSTVSGIKALSYGNPAILAESVASYAIYATTTDNATTAAISGNSNSSGDRGYGISGTSDGVSDGSWSQTTAGGDFYAAGVGYGIRVGGSTASIGTFLCEPLLNNTPVHIAIKGTIYIGANASRWMNTDSGTTWVSF